MQQRKIVMAIETSCDETAVAILADGQELLANIISSQIPLHQQYGGVVPELASRHHLEQVNRLVDVALAEAGLTFQELNAIAVTYGPGLVGALLVGVSTAKALAYSLGLPLLGVNHIEGHIYANWLVNAELEFPVLCLVVSGGHTALVRMTGHGHYEMLGQTQDDAVGEAFDKVARAMGLDYPGGPIIDKLAKEGNGEAFAFPRAWLGENSFDFSFSGVKTAVLNHINQASQRGEKLNTADLAASFQTSVVEVLVEKTIKASNKFGIDRILLAGGVAANSYLREQLAKRCTAEGKSLAYPPLRYCTDNAAMIACAAHYRLIKGERSNWHLNAVPNLRLFN